MPCWFYDKNALLNTPSIQDGIDHESECHYRKEGAQLIIQIGSQMELGYNTLATGIVYFHRFYMFHSFKAFSPYITACCCLFLAGKAEETPKKSKDIIKIAKKFLSEDKLLSLGENPREEVMIMEKILLQTMKFDLKVQHPYSYLLRYAKCLKGDKRKMQKMVQMAWTFINDSLCTTLSIQWEPEIVAIAVIHLAGKLVRLKINGWRHRKPSQQNWWEIIVEDLSVQVVEDICHQVLDLYSPLSRYYVVDSPQPIKLEPKNGIVNQSDSSTVSANIEDAVRDPNLENDASTVIAVPAMPLKDPRLESGSVFVKNHFNMNTLNTPVLVTSSTVLPENIKLSLSSATPIVPQSTDQSLQDNSQFFINLNTNHEPLENSRFHSFGVKFDASVMSSSLDPLETPGNSFFKEGFGNVDDWKRIENQGFTNGNNNNDHTNNRMMRNRGFGCVNNNNSDDCSENRPMRNWGFRNYGRDDHRGGYGHNHFRRQGFDNNNHGNSNDHNGNRSIGNRGFGNANSYDNRGHDENRLFRNRGFGNTNNNSSMCNEMKPFENRGFGNANSNNDQSHNDNRLTRNRGFGNANDNNSRFNDTKPFGSRGFKNSNSYNNNRNGNDSRPSMMYNRRNRFQRSEPYLRRFNNNNYENDRYPHSDTNCDTKKDSMSDAPDKILDKQPFNYLSIEDVAVKVEEEESWD